MTQCFRCGDDDHLSYDCPSSTPASRAPEPARELAPALDRPENKPIPAPVPASQRAQYGDVNPYAEQVRELMGWPRTGSEAEHNRKRIIAAEQVSESRAARPVI